MPTDVEPAIQTQRFAPTRVELWNVYNRVAVRRSWLAMAGVAAAGGAVVAMASPIPDWRQGATFAGLILLVVLALLPLVHWQRLGGKARRALYAPRRITFTASAMQVEDEQGRRSEVAYDAVWRVQSTIDGFLVYLDKARFLLVPYRAFADRSAADALAARLRERGLLR